MAEENRQEGNAPATPPAGENKAEEPKEAVYDLKLPEGSKMDPARVEAIKSWAKDKKIAPDAAQDVLNREHEAVSTYEANQLAEYEKAKETWLSDLKADKELGGENLTRKVELAKRVLKKFGSEGFAEMLDKTGYGNHPELVRVFARIGEKMGEDNIVRQSSSPGNVVDARELFYGKQS